MRVKFGEITVWKDILKISQEEIESRFGDDESNVIIALTRLTDRFNRVDYDSDNVKNQLQRLLDLGEKLQDYANKMKVDARIEVNVLVDSIQDKLKEQD
jgi:hypothetical protein